MEIKTFRDQCGRTIEVYVNMGREISIHQDKDPHWLFQTSVNALPVQVLQDILDFCQEHSAYSKQKSRIAERSITFQFPMSMEEWEREKVMKVTASFNGTYLSIKNEFPDTEGPFRSEVRTLLLETLVEALAFAQHCQKEHKEMMDRYNAKQQPAQQATEIEDPFLLPEDDAL